MRRNKCKYIYWYLVYVCVYIHIVLYIMPAYHIRYSIYLVIHLESRTEYFSKRVLKRNILLVLLIATEVSSWRVDSAGSVRRCGSCRQSDRQEVCTRWCCAVRDSKQWYQFPEPINKCVRRFPSRRLNMLLRL